MKATSDGYYAILDAQHQNYLDGLADWEHAVEEEVKSITQAAEREDDDAICAINEWICDNADEQVLHDLAFGSGAFDKLSEQRKRAIKSIAEKNLLDRQNDYDPD